jgi:hypothetical protein
MVTLSGKGKSRRQFSNVELSQFIDEVIHPLSVRRPELMMINAALQARRCRILQRQRSNLHVAAYLKPWMNDEKKVNTFEESRFCTLNV